MTEHTFILTQRNRYNKFVYTLFVSNITMVETKYKVDVDFSQLENFLRNSADILNYSNNYNPVVFILFKGYAFYIHVDGVRKQILKSGDPTYDNYHAFSHLEYALDEMIDGVMEF